ncbi:MAG: NAD(P)/FAD-dependent oxidoreductase [Pseudomonadales bacterium]|nr:NAD(P)/FAD-dependent oxidoreductase [Pseudomonadales bacterium]
MSISETKEAFDPEYLRQKYEEERVKRLRADGNEQYQEMRGDFSHFIDDPYVENPINRAPLEDEVNVAIIGGGIGGLFAGARLREAGVEDIRVIEKASDFGGTWYWNRYPGAACDIEAYTYLPLLEELDYMPPRKYADAQEILSHCQNVAKKYRLYDNACMQTEVEKLVWDEASRRWTIYTNRDDKIKARFVLMVNGPLNRPKLPGIKGISKFKGHTFHTSRWDYNYTGGNSRGGLTGLKDKRVGIIGTGATAIQCVSYLGESAKQLYVFQRTPSGVDFRNDHPTDSEWAAGLKPGWQKQRQKDFTAVISGRGGRRGEIEQLDQFDDAWVEMGKIYRRRMRELGSDVQPGDAGRIYEFANFEKMENVRNRVEDIVENKEVAEALKPYYAFMCKRPCLDDRYLPTFNRDNVQLVDTDGQGVEAITETGVIVDGVEYEVDCLIFATGFEVGTDYTRRAGYDLIGVDGISLEEKWSKGMISYFGIHSHGFPNCLLIGNGQAAFTANYPDALDEGALHTAHLIKHFLDNNISRVDATEDAEMAWTAAVVGTKAVTMMGGSTCTPGYYNLEGQHDPRSRYNQPYGGMVGANKYFEKLAEFRDGGKFPGLELS